MSKSTRGDSVDETRIADACSKSLPQCFALKVPFEEIREYKMEQIVCKGPAKCYSRGITEPIFSHFCCLLAEYAQEISIRKWTTLSKWENEEYFFLHGIQFSLLLKD